MKRLILLLCALLYASSAWGGEVCSSSVMNTCGGAGGAGGPVSTTTVVGTTSVSAGGSCGAANSVCLSENALTAEGTTDDTAELVFSFEDPGGDQTLRWITQGTFLSLNLLDPPTAASTTAGFDLYLAASNATAGNTNAGAAKGGSVHVQAKNAARFTSGNGDGGDVWIEPGSPIGTGAIGSAIVYPGSLSVGALGLAAPWTTITDAAIVFEGATDDAFETTIQGGDAAADRTLFVTAMAATGTIRLSTTASGSASNWIDIRNADVLLGSASVNQLGILSSGNIGINGSVQLVFGTASDPTGSGGIGLARSAAGIMKVTDGSTGGGNLIIGAGMLTASTMTAETTAQARDVTSSYTWTNAQVAALAGTAGDINVATLPAKTQVLDAMVVITGAAAGPATVTVSCGDAIAGTPFINYVVPSDAKAAANTVYGDAVAERGTSIDTEFWYLPSYTATTLVTCHFISTGANLSTVTGSTGRVMLTTRIVP